MTTTPAPETEISEVSAAAEPEAQSVTQPAAPPSGRPAGMQDMTTGPITRHLLKTTSFMLVTMVFQTLYFLIDLYWVGRLGTSAVAAVGIAGNMTFIVLALTQMLGVGTTTVVSHAVGRKDHAEAHLLFNQSQVIAIVVGIVWLATYFVNKESFLHVDTSTWKPRFDLWRRMLAIGLPAGFEFGILALYVVLVYSVTRPFGAAAQAGFGIGQRIIQAGFMPVVALGFAVAPVAGQNFGARQAQRVKNTFKDGAVMASVAMVLFAILSHIAPEAMVRVFSKDPAVIAVGAAYLRIISWNYVSSALIFFQSL